jgi:hypothetical protein
LVVEGTIRPSKITARAALAHSAFTGISRNHLDRLVAELAAPFHATREARLHHRRGDCEELFRDTPWASSWLAGLGASTWSVR